MRQHRQEIVFITISLTQHFLAAFAIADIHEHIHRSTHFASLIEERIGVCQRGPAAAVGTFNNNFFAVVFLAVI